ncbi:MAG: hypothetical protein AB1444_13730 [Spirochaetota bacterium]
MKQTQRTFHFSSDMRTYGMALLGLMGFAYLLFVSVPVFDFFSLLTVNKNDYLVLAILALGLMPFTLLGFYLFYRHSGYVILTQEAIILKRFGKEKQILYRDIVDISFTRWHIPEGIILKTRSSVLSFSTRIGNYPALWKILQKKVSPRPLEADQVSFPFHLSFAHRFWLSKILQFGALIAILCGIVIILSRDGETNKFNWRMGSFLILLSLGVLIAVIINGLSPKQFVRLRFTKQDITGYYINGKTKNWPVSNLKRITFTEKLRWFSVDGVEGLAPDRSVWLEFDRYPPLIISEKRAKDFGYTSERLCANLNYLYAQQLSRNSNASRQK